MYLNGFSVRIREGRELVGGYVELAHATPYSLTLHNAHSCRADAWVEVDGQHIGTFRLAPHSSVLISRPAHDRGCLTFYRIESPEAEALGLQAGDPNLGLIRVVFTPERDTGGPRDPILDPGIRRPRRLAGGTGLSGVSPQDSRPAELMPLDVGQQTTIHLRLVAAGADAVRPLTAFSTPVPPAV